MFYSVCGPRQGPSGQGRRPIGPPPFPAALVLLVGACLWGGTALHAQEAAGQVWTLSPDEAVDLAIKNNLSLESGRVTLDNKKRKSDLVWNQFLPTVSVAGTLIRDNWASEVSGMAPVPIPGTSGIYGVAPYSVSAPQWHVNGSLSVSYDFSFALVEGIKSIRMDYEAGLVTLEKAKRQLERDVRKSYNQIRLLQANAGLLRENYENAVQRAALADANYRAGRSPRLAALQAQVTVENMKPTISDMENNLKAALAGFAMNLGLPYNTPFELKPLEGEEFYIPLDVAELISQAASGGRPDILELQKSIQTLQSQRKAQGIQMYTPFLRLSWGLSSTFIKDPWADSWIEGDNWNKGGNFSLTLGINLNGLFPFTKEGQGLRDTDNALKNLTINLTQLVWATEMEVFNKVNSLEKTRTSAEAQRATVELAELSYRLTEDAYRAGIQDFLEVQNAALSLSQAKLQLLTQQFNYLNDLIDLEYDIGAPFGTLSGGTN